MATPNIRPDVQVTLMKDKPNVMEEAANLYCQKLVMEEVVQDKELDPAKVDAIIQKVKKSFPEAKDKHLKDTIQKLREEMKKK